MLLHVLKYIYYIYLVYAYGRHILLHMKIVYSYLPVLLNSEIWNRPAISTITVRDWKYNKRTVKSFVKDGGVVVCYNIIFI